MTRRARLFPSLAACLVALAAPAGPVAAESASAGAGTTPAYDTSRILSLGGDITEMLYALGADKSIVAVDSTSQFPPEALKEKKDVGYLRALSTEGVLSMNASLILASDRTGPPEVVKALKASPVAYVEIAEEFNPRGVANKARHVGRIVGRAPAGEELAARIEADFATLDTHRASIDKPLRVLFVLNVANGRATVGGSDTSADAILKLAGAENAAAAVPGFKPLSDEAMIELKPDAIVTMRRSNGGHDAEHILGMAGIKATPAAAANRIVVMDGLYLLGFGPRAPAAALDLMRALYPDLPLSRTELAK